MDTATILIRWYKKHKRDLPWRRTTDPYLIWLSEIILQQTRVDQGTAYYHKFSKKYPTVKKLAKAPEDEILKLWQGLGYYSRARNMHAAAKVILNNYGGIFPQAYEEIRNLKGVGDYTAAAISSFAFNKKYPVVDGNVYRFLSRYFGIRTPIQSSTAKKEFTEIARTLMADNNPHDFNQAIMEFGALQCKPISAKCLECPLNSSCHAFEKDAVHELPVKGKKVKTRDRYFYYLVIYDKNSIYLQKRTNKDVWQNLFEFPLIETKIRFTESKLPGTKEWKNYFKTDGTIIHSFSEERKHLLSHQRLHARFIKLTILDKNFQKPDQWERVQKIKVKNYAVPKLIDKYLEEQNLNK